ncbi:MAG TPA: hypothetical protein VN426_05065 [Syntrophomonadaceae bacterium]|nr:hypothetical protein [Syntrophomonadaceae bacterium]
MKGSREENIRQIIEMEDRIAKCQRCRTLTQCVRKPSAGKGELEPDLMMVFEYDNSFTRDIQNVIELRNLIKHEFQIDKIYHTFMVRCQPKACATRNNLNCFSETRLLNKDNQCLLHGRECEGIPIMPSDGEVMSCLPFLLEEINILNPNYLMLFGFRVGEYVLKSRGIFDIEDNKNVYRQGESCMVMLPDKEPIDSAFCQQVLQQMRA